MCSLNKDRFAAAGFNTSLNPADSFYRKIANESWYYDGRENNNEQDRKSS